MPRTIIDIPELQLRDLDARCETLRVSRAEGIRRAIEQFLAPRAEDGTDAFGLWRDDDERGREP